MVAIRRPASRDGRGAVMVDVQETTSHVHAVMQRCAATRGDGIVGMQHRRGAWHMLGLVVCAACVSVCGGSHVVAFVG